MPFLFRTRLTALYTLLLAALLTVASAVLIITLQRTAERKLDATLWILGSTEAEGIAARLRDRGLRNPDDLTIHDVDYRDIAGYEKFRVQKYVTVVDKDRRVADFSANLPDRPLPVSGALLARAFAGEVSYEAADVSGVGRLRLIYIPVAGGQTEPFVVVVGVPAEFAGADVSTLTGQIAVIILIVLVLAGACGWLLARRALRPVVETANAVRRITDRNLHERLPETQTTDEIGSLIQVFNELLARLDRAFEAQRRFTADASHEICTPLTILKGETEVALLERRTPREYEALLRSNLEEIERLSKLTNDLLWLARSDAGEQQFEKELLFLSELVTDVVKRLRPTADERGVSLRAELTEMVLAEGDHAAVQGIVYNLIGNALRYTPRGGSVRVALRHSADGAARLEVSDTGMGIPPEALPHVFERFYRADNARAHEPNGSGLGLAICRAMAAAHGGRIEVESALGKGSRFTLILPASASLTQPAGVSGEPA
jgi:heavy metal sensor kinase